MILRSAILAASLIGSLVVAAAPAEARPHHGHGFHRPHHRVFHPHRRHFHPHDRHGYRR